MRRISVTGMLLITGFIFATTLTAQQPKGPAKDDPKVPKVEVDKASEHKWPDKIGGRKLEAWVKDIVHPTDPSTREVALRTVQHFGPDATKEASVNLLHALSDTDYGVKLTAISMVPILGFAPPELNKGLDLLIAQLNPQNQPGIATRNAVITALGSCGPNAKSAIPNLVQFSISPIHEKSSWQNRQAAVMALAQIGRPYTPPPQKEKEPAGKEPAKKGDPKKEEPKKEEPKKEEPPKEVPSDPGAIKGILKALHDPSHMVKRTAVSVLLQLGPPDPPALTSASDTLYAEYRKELKLVLAKKNEDKSVLIWTHVLAMQSETKETKEEDVNLKELEKFLSDPEFKSEAIQAFGLLGWAARNKIGALMNVADDPKEDSSVIVAAMIAFSQIAASKPPHAPTPAEKIRIESDKKKVLPLLNSMKKHDKQEVKETAENCIAAVTNVKREPKKDVVVEMLLNVATTTLKDHDSDIVAAITALAALKEHGERIVPELEKLKKHTSKVVAAAAEKALVTIMEK